MNRAPPPYPQGVAGFTLIELLVVVLIIGIVMSFVSLSLDPTGPAERLHTEANRLDALVAAAADDAVLDGRQIGLDITADGYRFVRYVPNNGDNDRAPGWRPITDRQSPLRPRKLGSGLTLSVVSADANGNQTTALLAQNTGQGRRAPGGNDAASAQNRQSAIRPEAVFLSSGEIVPFTLELSAKGVAQRYDVNGQRNGRVAMKKIGGVP